MKTLVALLLFALPAVGQTVTAGQPFALAWDQDAVTLADAQSYSYKLYIVGAADQVFNTVTCAGQASPFMCQAPVLALAAGNYGLHLTATLNGNESPQSMPVYSLAVVNTVPNNPPTVTITAPTNGQEILVKDFRIKAAAKDDVGTTRLQVFINGLLWFSTDAASLDRLWNTAPYRGKGPVVISVTARDADGAETTARVTVTVRK